jgi:hypothetical protein
MSHLTPQDLYSLEEYAKIRNDFRAKVMAHKQNRKVHVGPNATLYFEDRLTMQYQIQEMLRVERIFEQEGIAEELGAYNPLIPDGRNFKATFMVEFPDIEERRQALERLIGIEDRVWVQVDGHDKVYAIADEDLEREDETKTSSVHFLRFELTDDMASALKGGADLAIGIDHPAYEYRVDPVDAASRNALVQDLA